MNALSTLAARLQWTSKLFAQDLMTWQGRSDFFKAFRARKRVCSRTYPIRLVQGTIFVDGQTAVIDLRVFAQVFLDEVYAGLQLDNSIVIDIGAHKGYFAAYALLRGAQAVVCYEPEDSNFRALSLFNESDRKHGQVTELHQEAGGDDGETDLYISADSWLHSTIAREDLEYSKKVKVRSRSLATILSAARERFGHDAIILKIDAEGAECPLLLQAPAEVFSDVKEIIFEFHSFSHCSLQNIVDKLKSVGFGHVAYVREADLHHFRMESPTGPRQKEPAKS